MKYRTDFRNNHVVYYNSSVHVLNSFLHVTLEENYVHT